MSMLLFIIGGIAVMAGAAMVAYGIPINEFSFGNTMIVAGTTLGTGGIIVIALAVTVAQLRRLADRLGEGAGLAAEQAFEAPAGRIPFPPKTRPVEPPPVEPAEPEPAFAAPASAPHFPEPAAEEYAAASFAPTLPNPEANLETPPAAQETAEPPPPPPPEPSFAPPDFEAMWPPPPPPPPPRGAEAKPDVDAIPDLAMEPEPEPPHETPVAAAGEAPQPVAILKSGVVDGMGYTLYVDGSIEAELPQGTVRFASIDELRAHLEKNA